MTFCAELAHSASQRHGMSSRPYQAALLSSVTLLGLVMKPRVELLVYNHTLGTCRTLTC